jgi:hypothetical protein
LSSQRAARSGATPNKKRKGGASKARPSKRRRDSEDEEAAEAASSSFDGVQLSQLQSEPSRIVYGPFRYNPVSTFSNNLIFPDEKFPTLLCIEQSSVFEPTQKAEALKSSHRRHF